MSFAMESSRYCNYSKGQFGGELTFIKPLWADDYTSNMKADSATFYGYLVKAEEVYNTLIKEGWPPQYAANTLPKATKTELIMTGFADDWKHFFELRALGTTGKPHPQAQELAEPLMKDFVNNKYVDIDVRN